MPFLDALALVWLLAVLATGLSILWPATSALAWYLRLGVPEVGWMLALCSVPALAWWLRRAPRRTAALALVLVATYGWPWLQASEVRRTLPARLSEIFPGALPERDPLSLGAVAPIEVSTAEYRPALSWDRYRPLGPRPRARILFLHGGSWARGGRADYPALLVYLAGRGYEVVSASYRLAPASPYPAAQEDVEAAIDRLAAEDDLPLVVMGRSAGAHLGMLAAYGRPAEVAGVIDLYGPVDMVYSWTHPSHPRVLDSPKVLRDFLGGSPEEVPEVYARASPVKQLTAGGPPTLVIHGDRDSMVFPRQATLLDEELRAKGVRHLVLRLPWLEHGGDVFLAGPTGRLGVWAIEAFLGWVGRRHGSLEDVRREKAIP